MLGSREDGEEALQDAFLRAYRGLASYQDRERFASWFYRILVNRCRSMLERRKRNETPREWDPGTDGPTPDALLVAHDQAARLLAQLPGEWREVFVLRYVDDLSYEEIAAITGVRVSALKMRVKRGLQRLRDLHQEQGND
jgi:RNA polymerase sigma-70 factor (ECF subfamily)